MISRRRFMKTGALAGAASLAHLRSGHPAGAEPAAAGLSDPAVQPKFVEVAPNALEPGSRFQPLPTGPRAGTFDVSVQQTVQQTGLRRGGTGRPLNTTVYGYGDGDTRGVSWPGRTFQVQSGEPTTVRWHNDLVTRGGQPLPHILPVDESLHWCYSLSGYARSSIEQHGFPIVTHLHGGHSDAVFDGNPEFPTETPRLGDTEIWEIYNATGDAHPIHLHLVHFEILDRQGFTAEVIQQPIEQHNGTTGVGFRLENVVLRGPIPPASEYVENAPKDVVTALPEQVTRIKVTFDKAGRYVCHCHILSHEDHEMMRVLHVK